MVPIYLFYLVIALWFFWRTAIETALIIFTKHKWSQNVWHILSISVAVICIEICTLSLNVTLSSMDSFKIHDNGVDGEHIKHVKSLLQV